MADEPKCEDLEISSDVALQERMWRAERIAWVVMGILVLATLSGAFGGAGPLSHASYQDPGQAFAVDYMRLSRHSTQMTLSYRLAPGHTEIWIGNTFLQGVTVEWITPEPERTARDGERTLFRFNAIAPDRPLLVEFRYLPSGFGRLPLDTGTPESKPVRLWSFVYP